MLISCGKTKQESRLAGSSEMRVEIEILIQDSTLNVRAMEIIDQVNGIFFLTSNGYGGSYTDYNFGNKKISSDAEIIFPIDFADKDVNYRAFALTDSAAFGLGIGSPAKLFRREVNKTKLVYKETHEKAFYDSMKFWNEQEGIAIGDPTEDCMSIIITRDGGNTWTKLSCADVPKAKEGEAAFAASDTNIAIIDNHTWVATGGMASRILYSPDKGKTWEIFETPIVQGKPTTGMYSLDFYDKNNGFAIGGDYTKAADSSANKIRTQDGGKTWQLVAENQSPGYRSCVQYIPNGGAKKLVAVGFRGIDYSSDAGNTWKHLSDDEFYTIRFLNDSVAFAGGNGRVAKLVFRESKTVAGH